LALPETRPTLFKKISGGIFELDETRINPESYAGGKIDFARGSFKPKSASSILQALSFRFFGCNLLVFVFLAFRICL